MKLVDIKNIILAIIALALFVLIALPIEASATPVQAQPAHELTDVDMVNNTGLLGF